MKYSHVRAYGLATMVVAVVTQAFAPRVEAQRGGPGGPPAPITPKRASAPIDLTGQWVSLVTEDWRYRQFAQRRLRESPRCYPPPGKSHSWDRHEMKLQVNNARHMVPPAF